MEAESPATKPKLCEAELCDRPKNKPEHFCHECRQWFCEECWKWHYCLPENHPHFEDDDDKSVSGD